MNDPRPDLKRDTNLWAQLLTITEEQDLDLAATLHGFRCGGLRLIRERQGWALRPEPGPESLWQTEKQYVIDRDKWLMPYKAEIVRFLDLL